MICSQFQFSEGNLCMKRLLLGGICLLLLGLAACGREAKKGPFTVLLSVEANTLDPHFATATIEWSILMNMFDPLIERRDDMRLAPALAERWEVDETKKIWTFHLRKGVKFHNGEPFDCRIRAIHVRAHARQEAQAPHHGVPADFPGQDRKSGFPHREDSHEAPRRHPAGVDGERVHAAAQVLFIHVRPRNC